jgi:hypothetical protein
MFIMCWYIWLSQPPRFLIWCPPPQSPHAPRGMEQHTDHPRYTYVSAVIIAHTNPDDGDREHHQKINSVNQLCYSWSHKKFQCIHLSWKLRTLCKTRHLFVHMHMNMIRTHLYTQSSCQAYGVRSSAHQNRSHKPTHSHFCTSVLQGCLYTVKGTQQRLCTKCMYQ